MQLFYAISLLLSMSMVSSGLIGKESEIRELCCTGKQVSGKLDVNIKTYGKLSGVFYVDHDRQMYLEDFVDFQKYVDIASYESYMITSEGCSYTPTPVKDFNVIMGQCIRGDYEFASRYQVPGFDGEGIRNVTKLIYSTPEMKYFGQLERQILIAFDEETCHKELLVYEDKDGWVEGLNYYDVTDKIDDPTVFDIDLSGCVPKEEAGTTLTV